jgi:TetR/AcrR family transcriptional regulator, transcriptional repressor for nem operon
MRYPIAETAEKHERALKSAARLFRERGFAGTSISEIMSATGLTHGSFYNHFDSKEDLLAEAFAHASDHSIAALEKFPDSEEGKQAMFQDYLSPAHRDEPGSGCIMAALATNFQTQPKTRSVVTQHVRTLIEKFEGKFPWSARRNKRKQAIQALALMVGSLILARIVNEPELSSEILGSSIQGL